MLVVHGRTGHLEMKNISAALKVRVHGRTGHLEICGSRCVG